MKKLLKIHSTKHKGMIYYGSVYKKNLCMSEFPPTRKPIPL